jgi:hypothetical protein
MEGADITLERLEHVTRALSTSRFRNQVFSAFLGEIAREDFIPYTADFLLQVEDVKWTIVSGRRRRTADHQRPQPRLLAQCREFVKAMFGDIGSAGGHRAMAKAVVPLEKFRKKFGDLSGVGIAARIGDLAEQFLSEPAPRQGPERSPRSRPGQRLIQIADDVVGVFEPDRQPDHAAGDAGGFELRVPSGRTARSGPGRLQRLSMPPRLAGALHDLDAVVERTGAVVASIEIEADHAAEPGHLRPRDLVVGM